jgi:predicted  nucleic acid-binding Zn-ribbon protein
MTLAEWFSLASVLVALMGVVVAIAAWVVNSRAQKAAEATQETAERTLSEQAGRHRERLETLERWQREKSIDRSEFVDLAKRVEDGEADVAKIGEGLNAVRVQMASIPAQLQGIRDLMERDNREFRHDISGLRLSVEKIADLFTQDRRAVS